MAEFPKRSQVDEQLCWDISAIFKDVQEAEAAGAKLKPWALKLKEQYEGKVKSLSDPAAIVAFLEDYEDLLIAISRYGKYYFLAFVVDRNNEEWRKAEQRVSMELSELSNILHFAQIELQQLPTELTRALAKYEPRYSGLAREIEQNKPHQLSPETEAALEKLSPTLNTPENLYNVVKFNDLKFPNFTVDGKEYPLSYVLYENVYAYSPDTNLRREAFRQFSKQIAQYKETTAAIYNTHVQKDKQLSELRKFDSVFDYLLLPQGIERSNFDSQISTFIEEVKKPMRRYAKLLKEVHGLDELHFADLKLPLDPDFSSELSYDEAKKIVSEVLAVAGDDYRDLLMPAFEERWLDFAQNEGKSTGGFALYVNGAHPYILMNWDNSVAELFTLVHELGHAGQFLLTAKENSFLGQNMSLYVVESPSTFHELLLGYYLMHKEDASPRFKRWVASLLIANTYYHNMVTHLHEAAYQREVYRLVDRGESIDAETCSRLFREVLEDFWGDLVILDEGAELTWMRQPHYYDGLYSYTYSAGLTIGTEMFRRLMDEGPKALTDWRKFLSAGNRYQPIEQAALAGIDISNQEAQLRTVDYISALVDECYALTETMREAE
ncbi:MAG: oligoendopeptidase F [Eubacteriales bacterium]|nr:oligoendopeptidase F [Eubacteriales bacterium]